VVVLSITPDLNSVRLANAALGVFKGLGYEKDLILTVNCPFARPGLSRAQIENTLGLPIQFVIPYYEGIFTQAINVGTPVLLANPDNGLVTVFEALAWRVSEPQLRQAVPASPTPTWQRLSQRRQAAAEAGRK